MERHTLFTVTPSPSRMTCPGCGQTLLRMIRYPYVSCDLVIYVVMESYSWRPTSSDVRTQQREVWENFCLLRRRYPLTSLVRTRILRRRGETTEYTEIMLFTAKKHSMQRLKTCKLVLTVDDISYRLLRD